MAENQAKVESEVPGAHNIRGDATTPNQNDAETSKPRIISSFIEVHPEVNDGEKVVRRHQVIRNGDHEKVTSNEDKTKIPILKLRQTVEKVKAKRQNSKEKAKKEFESQIPIRRTSLPKTTESKRTTEDEFDKLYEEVVKSDDTVVKALETKFEEIIHDYDENKLQPIDVEKIRKSKIPFLKRRSLHDAEGTQERNSRIIAARERAKFRKSLSISDENHDKISQTMKNTINNELDKGPNGKNEETRGTNEIIQVKNEKITINSPVIYTNNETGEIKCQMDTTEILNKPSTSKVDDSGEKEVHLEPESRNEELRETKISKTVSVEQDDSFTSFITQKTTPNETPEVSVQNITESKTQENEIKYTIQVETPVFKSEIHVNTEPNETQKIVEVKRTISYNSNEENFIENKLNNITIETEKLSEDITTFARTNSKEFDTNFTTFNVKTTISENTNDSRIENEEPSSQSKTEFNNNFINSYLRSRSRNFDTKFDDNNEINTPKIENKERTLEKESIIEKIGHKDQEIKNPFFDTPKFGNYTINNFQNDTTDSINNKKYNKEEKSDALNIRDKVKTNEIMSKKEITNSNEVKERDDEFVTTFSGKVGRLISKIDSKEQIELESQGKDSPNELPKKKSVLSKIAMFESLESEIPAKTKAKPKSLKITTTDIQPEVKTHVHVHTPLIVNEIFKTFYTKHGLDTIEPLKESEIEKYFIEDNKELYPSTEEGRISIENDYKLYDDMNIVEIDSTNTDVFADINTIKDVINEQLDQGEINIKNISNEFQKPYNEEVGMAITPKDKNKQFKYEKLESNAQINDAPVIVPKFRPVREILGQFEPKYKNSDEDEVFHQGTFSTKVKEALDELKQADIDVKHILKLKGDEEMTEQNTDKTKDFDQETAKIEDKGIKFDTKRDKTSNLQDFSKNVDTISIKNKDLSIKTKSLDNRRTTSVADLYPGQAKGKVSNIIFRMKSYDRIELDKKEVPINIKEMPRKRSVSEKIALFERKLTPINADPTTTTSPTTPIKLTHPSHTRTNNPIRPSLFTSTNLITHPSPTTPFDSTHPSPTTPFDPTHPSSTAPFDPTNPSSNTPFDTTHPSPTTPFDSTHRSPTTPFDLTHPSPTTPFDSTNPISTAPFDPTNPNPTIPFDQTHPSSTTTNNPTHPSPTTTIILTHPSYTNTNNPTHPSSTTPFTSTHSGSTTTLNPTHPSSTTPFTSTHSGSKTTINPTHLSATTTNNPTQPSSTTPKPITTTPDEIQEKIQELQTKYGFVEIPTIELSNGLKMPVIAVGTANLDPRLIKHIIHAAIDMGYRAIDTAYIYGNEAAVGEAIRDKIQDGTVKREDLFIISKLWSTYHREDLVEKACNNSLTAMGLEYFDLYLIHNPMSFKEGPTPLPKIATVLQYSTNDYMNAWYGMEPLVTRGLVKGIGVSNFNSSQVARVSEKGRFKPVVNQVECHPYLSQERLNDFCAQRNVTLSCFGVLGSKGTPPAYRGTPATVIDDPIVKVMAGGLNITPAQLLIAYQLNSDRTVVVKSSSAAHLWDNLQALKVNLKDEHIGGLRLMHRNKRIFTFAGMGDTHKNYPFNAVF